MTDMLPTHMSFDQFLRHWAEAAPTRTALTEEDREYDFAALDALTAGVATMLADLGLAKGDRIAWIGKNSDLYVLLFFGAARMGVVMVPIGWRLAGDEWAYIVNDTRAKLLFTGPGFDDAVAAIRGQLDHVEQVIGADEARSRIAAAPRRDFAPSGPDDAVLQLYTSGTTGRPKGAILSNRNLFGLRLPNLEGGEPWTRWDEGEGVLVAMPCAHIGGTGLNVMALAAGVASHVLAEFDTDRVLDLVQQGRITRFFMVPAALHLLLQNTRCASTDFSRLKYILYGAAPIPLELLRACIQTFGADFIQAYGMTETTGTVIMLPPEDHDPNGNARMRSAGRPMKGVEVRIVDTDGNDVAPGAVGEIITRSSNNMLGYWNLPDATASTLDADGWVHTGDAGYMDGDGYIFIHDRMKDMIITGGENVYPAEVESAIFGHPQILEVAVIGIPDAKWGESVKAVCVPRPGMTVDEADIIAWARDRIAPYKCPRSVDVIAALPRNASGKILRKDLRAPYWEGRERMVN
ncbi:MAG: fatty acid--CoA ligase [Sphingopyxis sp.]|uniref:fatty acid--CoA ligase n=1 Tax=Sphingopyxis sp. TaxID=1908224 RepID=UPI003D80D586